MKALLLSPMGSVHRRFNKANIDALRELGYDVELAANFSDGDGPESRNQIFLKECICKRIAIHHIPFERHSLRGSIKCLPTLKKLLQENNYDIVHAHTETGGLLLRLCKSVKGNSVFIYTPHGMSFWKGSSIKSQLLYKPIEKWICAAMDYNLGMNREEVFYLEKWGKDTSCYIHGIGLDLGRFQSVHYDRKSIRKEFEVAEGSKLLVSVGELDDNKNHAIVVKALSKLNRKDFVYVICGVGPNDKMLKQLVRLLKLDNHVCLAGYRDDIPQILNAADIFVFPSFHEGMPVSALEAMACGLPVICSKVRGNVDIVSDNVNGFLFNPNDSKELSNHINKLLDNCNLRMEMGKCNLEIVKSYSYEAVKKELKDYYNLNKRFL